MALVHGHAVPTVYGLLSFVCNAIHQVRIASSYYPQSGHVGMTGKVLEGCMLVSGEAHIISKADDHADV